MDTSSILKTIFAGASGVAVIGMGLTLGTAQAETSSMSQIQGLLPEDPVPSGASGPYTCCPGDEKGGLHSETGRGCPSPTDWDQTRCHAWWGVYWGHGNVSPGIWEGPEPPPPEALRKPWCGFPFMCSGTP